MKKNQILAANDSQTDDNAAQEKALKKQFESYIEVLKHKNHGQVPSLEEVVEEIAGQTQKQDSVTGDEDFTDDGFADDFEDTEEGEFEPQQTQEMEESATPAVPEPELSGQSVDPAASSHPKILNMKIYYGMSPDEHGVNHPDEGKILYYEDGDGLVYDCNSGQYTDEKPEIMNHLPSRPVRNDDRDIVQAIMHGVLDDDDFTKLSDAGMVSDQASQMKKNMDKLQKLIKEKEELEMSQQFDPTLE